MVKPKVVVLDEDKLENQQLQIERDILLERAKVLDETITKTKKEVERLQATIKGYEDNDQRISALLEGQPESFVSAPLYIRLGQYIKRLEKHILTTI